MKITTKIKKLGSMLALLFVTTAPISYSTFKEKQKLSIKDIKSELKTVTPSVEKQIAKTIDIKNDGITYKNEFVPKTNNFRVLTVRLTVYWAKGGNTDSDSRKCLSSTGYTLKQGDSIAVDPRIIPYEKDVIIPNVGLVKAVDTGTAVVERKASGGKMPVIDVFFINKKDAEHFANNYPKVVKVAVLN
jgi:3D (Asp-Asp-Asp) domain-containing protein